MRRLIPPNCNAVAALGVVLEIVLGNVIGGAADSRFNPLMAPWGEAGNDGP